MAPCVFRAVPLRDKIRGALLGTAVGDALGAPLEGCAGTSLTAASLPARSTLRWTDDTQMMLDTARWVLDGSYSPEALLRYLADGYEPALGYGHGTKLVLEACRSGRPWGACPFVAWPEGSKGNGSCVRVAPVAARYLSSSMMAEQFARMSSWVTHAHPAAVAGAVAQTEAIRSLLTADPDTFDHATLLDAIAPVAERVGGWTQPALARVREFVSSRAAPDRVRAAFDCSRPLAQETLPVAWWAVAAGGGRVRESFEAAVAVGGDLDTICALTGALVGALRGAPAFFEAGFCGADGADVGAILSLADGLSVLAEGA